MNYSNWLLQIHTQEKEKYEKDILDLRTKNLELVNKNKQLEIEIRSLHEKFKKALEGKYENPLD